MTTSVVRAVGELPALAELGDRERLLALTWLTSLRSARTRPGLLRWAVSCRKLSRQNSNRHSILTPQPD
jgi:hypothetical protein